MLRGGLHPEPHPVILCSQYRLETDLIPIPMPELFGHTRAHVGARHALLTPANHVKSNVPGVTGAAAVVLVSPAMGAKVAQTLLTFESGGSAHIAASDTETFGYVMEGGAAVSVGDRSRRLKAGGFFFCPAGS
jgi:(S)-ureidoglycine aminohydrolase